MIRSPAVAILFASLAYSAASSRVVARRDGTPAAPSGVAHQAWDPPRREAAFKVVPVAELNLEALLYPADLQLSESGLLVFDHGGHALRIVNLRTRSVVRSLGRQGSGPGEFTNPAVFFGSRASPYLVEFSKGRVTRYFGDSLAVTRVASSGRWASGCTWAPGHLLLQTAGHPEYDFFITSIGDSARITDSLALPWEAVRGRPFMERQASLRQLDDSTCAMLPLYQREFAIISPSKAAVLGVSPELLPPARLRVERSAKVRMESLTGARPGALDAKAWRQLVLVLFGGTTRYKFRILDAFDRQTLQYQGSVRLPLEATRIAIRGDTLVALADRDGEPVLSVLRLLPIGR